MHGPVDTLQEQRLGNWRQIVAYNYRGMADKHNSKFTKWSYQRMTSSGRKWNGKVEVYCKWHLVDGCYSSSETDTWYMLAPCKSFCSNYWSGHIDHCVKSLQAYLATRLVMMNISEYYSRKYEVQIGQALPKNSAAKCLTSPYQSRTRDSHDLCSIYMILEHVVDGNWILYGNAWTIPSKNLGEQCWF